jgi:hypothetical protein
MEFDSYDQFDIEYDRGGYDDSEDREVVEDHPTPEEVAAFWAEVRPDNGIPF